VALTINISADMGEAVALFDSLAPNKLASAARRAANRTLVTLRKEAIIQIMRKLKIKSSVLRAKHIDLNRAKGASLGAVEASIDFSKNPIPMLEFVKGNKDPIEQKGIKVSKRRKLKAEIQPGRKFVVKKAFIQRGPHSKQVYKSVKRGGFKKQGIRSIGFLIEERGVGEYLIEIGAIKFSNYFLHELDAISKGFVK
jgi:hypothetical protein